MKLSAVSWLVYVALGVAQAAVEFPNQLATASIISEAEVEGKRVTSPTETEIGSALVSLNPPPPCRVRNRVRYTVARSKELERIPNVLSAPTCCQLCRQERRCLAWTHNAGSDVCILMAEGPLIEQSRRGSSSGSFTE